ncbi:MAG: radical SAM family heme chaperone HemW, partial [Vicinamibacteria bacterium]
EQHRRGKLTMLPPDEQGALYERAARLLERAGFGAYEISNFARPGRESRHNQIYWTRGDYIGLGAGAHSHRARRGPRRRFGLRWWNEKDFRRYIERVEKRGTARAGMERIDRTKAMCETMLLELRLAEGLDLGRYEALFGESFTARHALALEDLESEGFIERAPGKVRLTASGRNLADSLFANLA